MPYILEFEKESHVTRGNNPPSNRYDLRSRLSRQNSEEQRTSQPRHQERQRSYESAQPPPPPLLVVPTLVKVLAQVVDAYSRGEELKPSSRRSRTKKGASHRLTLDKLSRRGAHLAPVQQEDRVGEELRTVPRA
nr:hypothetical protein Iba_chr15aCG8420 [Ipomoea batatas]